MQLVICRINRERRYEESFRLRFAHGMRRATHDGRGIHGLRKKRAHLPAIGAGINPRDLMRSQHGKRVAVRTVEDGFDLLRSHAQLLWQRVVSRQE